MSANTTNFAAGAAAPVGCLSEHLDYFSDNIAAKQPMLDGDFDALFHHDFDLVFDPILLSDAATVARPVQQQDPQPVPAARLPVVPMAVPSSSTNTSYSKPVIKVPIRKSVPPQVSPTSVTAVFESIPAPPSPVATTAVVKTTKITTSSSSSSSPRKRSYSMVQSSPKPAPVSSSKPVDSSNMSFEEQEDLRRERNRHHAKRSRQRKRDYMNSLEEAVNEMRKENERLFDLLGMDSRRAKADMAQEEERKKAVATEKFIAGLRQPRNRVLDNTTLAFLRELWK